MKIEIIKTALNNLKAALNNQPTKADSNLMSDVDDSILTLSDTDDLYQPADRANFDDRIAVIPLPALIEVLNLLTYDIYGKLARAADSDVLVEDYIIAVRNQLDVAIYFTDQQLTFGYDYLSDLWLDNEAAGSNNADGSFKA